MKYRYEERFYRLEMAAQGLVSFRVVVGRSDLFIWADRDLKSRTEEELNGLYAELDDFIGHHPRFRDSLVPYPVPESAPPVARQMAWAAEEFAVGPMAGVAGAVADQIGRALLEESGEILVENGGDLFIASGQERKVGIFAGESPLSGRLALLLPSAPEGLGLCTSSATVGPSLSLGKADAALVMADSAVLADAAASALGNRVKKAQDIEGALAYIVSKVGVRGALVIMGEHLGAAGDLNLIRTI
jgi:ApbE superfamily uncharacterized protein (UPF0280 family)